MGRRGNKKGSPGAVRRPSAGQTARDWFSDAEHWLWIAKFQGGRLRGLSLGTPLRERQAEEYFFALALAKAIRHVKRGRPRSLKYDVTHLLTFEHDANFVRDTREHSEEYRDEARRSTTMKELAGGRIKLDATSSISVADGALQVVAADGSTVDHGLGGKYLLGGRLDSSAAVAALTDLLRRLEEERAVLSRP